MEYTQIGRSGLRVSRQILGAMNFGAATDRETSGQIINEALDAGINAIDTADCYSHGLSEEIVGETLAQNGRRDDVVIATKFTTHMGQGPNDWGQSRYHIVQACEASLRRLKTDRIDLYQAHWMDMVTPLRRCCARWTTLCGKARCATSGYPNSRVPSSPRPPCWRGNMGGRR